ncbi:MAG TPA: PilW family protein [Aquabacterium sp.]|uniref:PilW family protein n=1 Tax=Aquabacterium sp. TaxID=1872578 RepID=UPI002E2FCE64|nr:PilW family protein [Aquabacterium sp.]HEX5355653.1 PilW family protein [Aquabacterium sp.]
MCTHASRSQKGFSLVEVMVALAIGMATVVIMLQMLSNSEASKRTAGGGNDAQMNGTLALFNLERDIQASGYGINSFNVVGCSVTYTTSADSTSVTIPLAPTTINPPTAQVPAGDANTDTLLVVYGNGSGSAEGDPLISNSTAGSYPVSTTSSFNVGDIVMAQASVRPTPCTLTTDVVTNVPTSGSNISVQPGVSGLGVGAIIYNLGNAPVAHAYAVRNGNLTMCDYSAYNCGNAAYANPVNSTVWVPIANNIVALRAQYGRDNNNLASTMTGVVSTYNQITPASTADTSGLSPFCSWARTLSVRMAVVARSAAYDKTSPTGTAPTWTGATVSTATSPTNPSAVSFDLSGDANWQNYRYKTLETTVPLRNSIWQGGQASYQGGTGC